MSFMKLVNFTFKNRLLSQLSYIANLLHSYKLSSTLWLRSSNKHCLQVSEICFIIGHHSWHLLPYSYYVPFLSAPISFFSFFFPPPKHRSFPSLVGPPHISYCLYSRWYVLPIWLLARMWIGIGCAMLYYKNKMLLNYRVMIIFTCVCLNFLPVFVLKLCFRARPRLSALPMK